MNQSIYEKPNCGIPPEPVISYLRNTPTAFDDFKNTLSDGLYMNVSFGNGSVFSTKEISIGVESSLCLRILYPYFSHAYSSFTSFYDAYINKHIPLTNLSLESTFSKINFNQCIVLGIDEVNVLYHVSKEGFRELFLLVGSFSCIYSPLFVPVLAGTVIGPMKSVISDSMYPPLHIPLPLLSFESCLHILCSKDKKYEYQVNTNHSLRQVVSDIGGHCRALEILYFTLSKYSNQTLDAWEDILSNVRNTLSELYPMTDLPLYGKAIAYSFLSLHVREKELISDKESTLTFLNMEELGLLKLKRLPDMTALVQIPLIFIMCFLQSSPETEYSKFWSYLLICKKMHWQTWEEFNWYYMAFRLSLFSKLEMTSISLSVFLSGAKMNIPNDIILKIPCINDIKTWKRKNRYPSTDQTDLPIGTCVLNAPGAAFDAFFYLETTQGKLLFAQQMKLASKNSESPQKITIDSITEEYHKVNDSIANHIPKTDFILLVLGRCEGNYNAERLPSKCAVITLSEFQDFYGDMYFEYLKKEFQ